ncbi:hypothetical protein K474DRAFT_973250 [Panus rudis PR-1116 ss-1]|nr:hypothetical protein K474DRAFT_973250 [Panus rudis PR-1116 ss-1]
MSSVGVIGMPITYQSGVFAGRTILAELKELQKADLGRKYANRDRRPLDPPPVVQMRLWEVFDVGTPHQTERVFEDLEHASLGMVCYADLFMISDDEHFSPDISADGPIYNIDGDSPWVDEDAMDTDSKSAMDNVPTSSTISRSQLVRFQSSCHDHRHNMNPLAAEITSCTQVPGPSNDLRSTISRPNEYQNSIYGFNVGPIEMTSYYTQVPGLSNNLRSSLQYVYHPWAPPQAQNANQPRPYIPDFSSLSLAPVQPSNHDSTVVGAAGGFTVMEQKRCTDVLVGTKISQAIVMEDEGQKVLMFTFPDLSVRMTGTFVLGYRAFQIFSRTHSRGGAGSVPMLAECLGGPFKIYSTKEFPGLQPSTYLSKRLSLHGVKLTTRANLRIRRKKEPSYEGEDHECLQVDDKPAHSGW